MFQKWSSGTGTSGDLSKPSTASCGGCAWPAVKPIRALFPNPAGWLGRGLEIVHTLPACSATATVKPFRARDGLSGQWSNKEPIVRWPAGLS